MSATKNWLLVFALSWVPYLIVSWAAMHVGDGRTETFWLTLAALLVVRLFYSIIEALGSSLIWRLVGRRGMVQNIKAALVADGFPKSLPGEDGLQYLHRIDDEATPLRARLNAREILGALKAYEGIGILVGMRMHAAMDEAVASHHEAH